MATSYRAFLIELYEEYLEEASFLYAQRRRLLKNPEIKWRKIGDFEDRLEAHIDGLVVGDKLALEVCKRQAAEGDFGELYAATCVFCRQGRRDLVLASFDQLEPGDAEKASAIADALKYELPAAWAQDFLTLLGAGDPKLAPILARTLGYRRVQSGPQLLRAMQRCTTAALPELVWALGRVGDDQAKEALLNCLKSQEEPISSAAALALLRLGEPRALDHCLREGRSKSWPILPLGMGGGHGALELLTDLAGKAGSGDCLTALALLGDPASVPLFLPKLEDPEAAEPAAMALECLTGANLYETVFIPDEIDEAELSDSEREQLKQGKPLDRGDGRPFGSTITRISQNPEQWQSWWRENGSRFYAGVRYRAGGPVSPARLIDMLSAPNTPHQLRLYCCEELVTRYAKDFGLETDAPVTRQNGLLSEANAWKEPASRQFQEGAWYFAGFRRD